MTTRFTVHIDFTPDSDADSVVTALGGLKGVVVRIDDSDWLIEDFGYTDSDEPTLIVRAFDEVPYGESFPMTIRDDMTITYY